VRQYLLAHGDHIEGMRLLAKIGMQLEVADDAELLLENVVRLAPEHRAARYEYALVLLQRHKHRRARDELEALLQVDPGNRVYRTTYATLCTGFGDYRARCAVPGDSRANPTGRGAASVDCACLEDSRPRAAGDRLLSVGRRAAARYARPTGAWQT